MSLTVTASATTVDGSDTVSLTAAVANDKKAAGVTWSVSGGGTLSGTTTTGATYTAPAATKSALTVTVTATSAADSTKTGTVTITVPAMPTVSTTNDKLTGTVGAAFSVSLQGSGGIPPYKNWAVSTTGSALPTCLTLSSAGMLATTSGTAPTAACAGTYTNLVFTYSDSGTPKPLTAISDPMTVTIVAAPAIAITPTLPAGAVGTAYAGSVAATGGAGALTYSVSSGALPADLALNAATGAITGTPKAADAGTASFKITAADAFGDTATSGPLTINVAAAPAITFTPGGAGTVALAGATYHATYSATITAAGGAGTLTLTETGALPAGLTYAGGVISGKPTAVGTTTFSVQAADAFGDSATQSFSIAVTYPAMTVNALTLPTGYLGSAYAATSLTATGGTGVATNYTWALAGGTNLPAGLQLSAAGGISGTPSGNTTGTVNFQVTVTDTVANLTSSATALSIVVKAGVSINAIVLPGGYVGSAYPPQGSAATISATGGAGAPYTWTMTAATGSSVPAGLSIGASTGAITGTPTAAGTYSVVITATDGATPANTASVTLPITIGAGVSVTIPALSPGYPGTAYTSSAFTASGGTNSGFQWSWAAASGSSLPSGLSIGSLTGTVTGTPVNAGSSSVTSNVVVTATDSLGNKGTATATVTIEGTLTITTASLPAATVGANYSQGLVAAGGSGTYTTWALTSGGASLANVGLSLNAATGVVSGAAPTLGTAIFSVTVTDSQGHVSAAVNYTIDVNNLLKVNQAALPAGDVGASYSQTLTASGGTGLNYTWSATSSNLASYGLTLSAGGVITGTLTQSGTASFTAKVTDSGSNIALQPLSITVYNGLSLPAGNSLPQGYTGLAYSGSVTGSGGSGNLSIAVTTTLLPINGTLATSVAGTTVNIGGTPTTATTESFGVTLTDISTGFTLAQTYSIPISTPTAPVLPAPNPASLPSATVNTGYSGSVTATGGVGPNYTWTVNSTVLTNGNPVNLGSSGLTVTTSGNNVLTVDGTPTATGQVQFPVNVKDNTTNLTSSAQTYTIQVNAAGSQVSGQVYFNGNFCNNGQNVTLPPFTISINTSPVQTTTTDGSGNYSFAVIPNGTYTLTPSMVGSNLPEYMFTPGALTNVVVNNNTVSGENFNVLLGYTVSGTVAYGGSATGPIYLGLNSSCGGSAQNGTAISAPGAFTIRGVAPGNYTLNAWRDNLGYGQPNASNPAASISNISVTDANVGAGKVNLGDPGAVSLTGSAPSISLAGGFAKGVAINFNPITNNQGVETPASYTVQWSTSNATNSGGFTSLAGSHSIPATGANGSNVWIVNTANVTGLSSGGTYYFLAQGVAGSSTSGISSVVGPVTLTNPTTGNTVSGAVTWTGTATGPLYVGFYDQSTGKVYATQVGSQANPPTSPASYSVLVPTGANYFNFGVVDQNNDGLFDPGDITNTNSHNDKVGVSISGNTTVNVTLPSAASTASVTTQLQESPDGQGGTNSSYSLNFSVIGGNKLPVAATLTSGPNVLNPIDMGSCGDNCGKPEFDYNVSVGGVPKLNDSYGFNVTYSDGSTGTVTAPVTGVLTSSALATLISPTGTGIADQPNFDWTYPANAGNYTYQFWLCCGNNGNIWQIPGNNSKANAFTNTQITPPLDWGVDPTDSNNLPSQSKLDAAGNYSWSVQSQDSNGNSAQMQMNFTAAGSGPLSLPATDPSTLPAAVLNAPYNGTISATGGAPPYQYLVSGSSCYGCNPVTLSNGLEVTDAHDNTLAIGGTPNSTGTVTFQTTVKDSLGATYGPVTYTIAINNSAPVSLPAANTTPLGGGLVGVPYGGNINASGGAGGGNYSFVVNGTTVPTDNTIVTIANGDGLTAKNSGGNTLFFAGTPATAETVSLTVKVIDTANTGDTATVTYSVVMTGGPSGINNGNLKGTYTCKVNGFNDSDGSQWASLTSLVVDGSGHITSGGFHTNGTGFTAVMQGTLTGTYSIGADNNGLLTTAYTFTSGGTGSGSNSWAIALTNAVSPAQQIRMVETDDVGASPSGRHATANCYLATTSAFTASTINGKGFAFGMRGENSNGTPKAYVGRFSASGGSITSGILDGMRVDQSGNNGGTVTSGTYTSPDANGRFDLTLNGNGSSMDWVVYIIDANRMFALETAGDTGLMAGDMRTQQQSSYSSANWNGPFVLYSEAWDGWNGSSVTAYDDDVFQGSGNSSGITINESYQDNNATFDNGGAIGGPISITFDSSNPGRSTFPAGNDSGFLYMFNNNSAIYLGLNGSNHHLEFGWIEPQTQSTFTNAALAGTYMIGNFAVLDANSSADVGEVAMASGGSITANISNGGKQSFTWDQAQSGMAYSWLSATYGSLSLSGGGDTTTCIVISASKVVCLNNTSSSAKMSILQE